MGVSNYDRIQIGGESAKPGSTTTVTVKELSSGGNVLRAIGTTVPTDGEAGYATGCEFIKTNGSAGSVKYINEGTSSSCDFNVLVTPASAQGSKTVQSTEKTVATTGNTDFYFIVPEAGVLSSIDFSGIDALAANDTNYVTFSLTNLGQAGGGSTAMLAATDPNTSKATGGAAIAANTKRSLTLHGTAANLVVAKGDRLRLRVAATGTLANTITGSLAMARFAAS